MLCSRPLLVAQGGWLPQPLPLELDPGDSQVGDEVEWMGVAPGVDWMPLVEDGRLELKVL